MIVKDWLLLFRDMRRIAGLMFPMLMAVVYVYLIMSNPVGGPGVSFWWGMILAPITVFFLGMRLAMQSLVWEGPSIALLRSAPLTANQILVAKLWASWLPMLLVAEVTGLATLAILTRSAYGLIGAALALAVVSLALAVLGVACSGLSPRFRGEATGRSAGVLSSYLYMLMGIVHWLVIMASVCWLWLSLAPATDVPVRALLSIAPEVQMIVHSVWVPLGLLVANIALALVLRALWAISAAKLERWQVTSE